MRILLALLVWLAAAPAGAVGFTLDSVVAFTDGTTSGNLRPVLSLAGTPTCGGCDIVTTDVLILDVEVTAGTVDEVQLSALVVANLAGLGFFDDLDDVTTGITPSAVNPLPPVMPTAGQFVFLATSLTAGTSSDRIFITLPGGTLSGGETASIGITPSGGSAFSETGTITAIPEPETVLLLALGLAGLALAGRRRTSA